MAHLGMLEFFQGQLPVFKKRADAFLKQEEAAGPKQLDALKICNQGLPETVKHQRTA